MNNVIYNWKGNTCYGGESANTTGTYRAYNILNNYYKPGPVTPSNHIWFLDPTTSCSNCTDAMKVSTVVPGRFYLNGNYMEGKDAMSSDNWSGGTTASSGLIAAIRANAAFSYPDQASKISVQSASDAFSAVVAYAGASLSRDIVDERIARETQEGTYTYQGSNTTGPKVKDVSTKGLIDSQSDVGGWPEYTASNADIINARDADRDGMPDWFEEQFGLDKDNAADAAAKSFDAAGRYTNLEMYLHYLVKDIVAAQTAGATYQQL